MRTPLLAIAASLMLAGIASAATINVPGDYPTIQGAIDASIDGDTILIDAGTYLENNIDPHGKAIIISGATGKEGMPAVTIDGSVGSGSVLYCQNGETSDTVFENLVITRAGTGAPAGNGAGMANYNNSSPTIVNCVFSGNESYLSGGGMYNHQGSSPMVENCHFIDNVAAVAGGAFVCTQDCNPTFTQCTFVSNVAVYQGGAGDIQGGSPTFVDCDFTGNIADNPSDATSWGGGLFIWDAEPLLHACRFNGNSATSGGGVSNYEGGNATLIGCSFSGNMASYGGGMRNQNSSPVLENCSFTGNTADGTFGIGYGYGGAMANHQSDASVESCTFQNNSAITQGGGMYNYECSPSISYSLFCANDPSHIVGSWMDEGGNDFQDVCPADCDGDINGDGTVNVSDLLAVIADWGDPYDVEDLLLVIGAWGPCP